VATGLNQMTLRPLSIGEKLKTEDDKLWGGPEEKKKKKNGKGIVVGTAPGKKKVVRD